MDNSDFRSRQAGAVTTYEHQLRQIADAVAPTIAVGTLELSHGSGRHSECRLLAVAVAVDGCGDGGSACCAAPWCRRFLLQSAQ